MVTDNFSKSSLDLNGKVSLSQPTSLDWGPDGRLYVTEVTGNVKVLTVAFGDADPNDDQFINSFYVTEAETLTHVKDIPNFNDDGSPNPGDNRQVTGISVVQQYAADGTPVIIDGKPAVSIYVTSSDSRIGAGGDGADSGLDTNSGVITRIDQTETGWEAVDLVRGLARSEENHALNGLEVIQEVDENGNLVSERMIVASGGNTNSGAPSNNFAGQQETAYSAAILEVDLDQLNSMPVLTDTSSGRQYIYDIPTLDDPTRPGELDSNDPFGGNDSLNAGKIDPDGPVQIYSAGYRNSYDVEVTEDGRVWTYDNGANNSWGGRPIGEAGDDGANLDSDQLINYVATNLNNGDINAGDPINLENWSPKNYDQFHEVTRSDDLSGRILSAGQGGVATYEWFDPDSNETLTLVYGGHPNPTRASGGQSGILFTPKDGVSDSYLLLSNVVNSATGTSDFDDVFDWLTQVENTYGTVEVGDLTGRLIAVTPGEHYYITNSGKAYLTSGYAEPPAEINGETVLGSSGMPIDFHEVVQTLNPIEGDYREGGYTDGALDSGKGSINGLTEYTSTILDDPENGVKMSGAILAASLNQGNLVAMGRDENGVMQTTVGSSGQTLAADRVLIDVSGAPLGLTSIGDDLSPYNGETAFQGSIWTTVFKQNGPFIEILQPNNGAVPLAGSEVFDPTDQDLDGIDHIHDPFEFSEDNGFDLAAGERVFLDFQPTGSPYPGTLLDTGLMGAALDGVTPNRDAKTAEEGFNVDQQEEGLYDLGGNIIPGGNAPILQIKKVAGGSVVGAGNTARDAMHVGINPAQDVERLVISSKIKNWVPSINGGIKQGQLTGIMLSDGTQANFLRFMFGAVMVAGELVPGFEVGYELGDANYTTLATVGVPALGNSNVALLNLALEVDIDNGFAVKASYRLDGDSQATELDLGGFNLPPGVLQDILTGNHTITDGGITLPSGAAVGFLAETTPEDAASEDGLSAVDFYNLNIEAIGNEIQATTAEQVGSVGTDGVDTILYTGTDTNLAPLDPSVENFDGSSSGADFHVTGHSGDNIFIAGAGNNTFTGGGGADSVRGTFATINGSVITDFLQDDHLLILESFLSANTVTYRASGGALILTFADSSSGETSSVSFTGPQFENFDPAEGSSVFKFEQTPFGTQVTYSLETVIYRVNAGGGTVAALDGGLDWEGDTNPDFVYLLGNTTQTYSDTLTDEAIEIDVTQFDADVIPWQVFAQERYDGSAAEPKIEYAFPVIAGETYSVTLYYTENWGGIFTYAGDRIFDVEVEGAVPGVFNEINPLQDAKDILGPDATNEELLGFGLSRTYTFTAGDDALNLAFNHGDQNPKINAIEIKKIGAESGVPDSESPVVQSITVEEPQDNDSPILATVVISDNIGIDIGSVDGNELIITGIEPATLSLASTLLTNGGKTATVQYQLTPPSDTNSWANGSYTIGIAEDSYLDTSGNGVAPFETEFTIGETSDPATIFELDFETAGDPLIEGGFDGVLGGISDTAVVTAVEGGDLVVYTSNGDIIKGQSANDFIKYVDLSDAALNELHISSHFDNAFPEALAAEGLSTATIPNYAQQGLLFGLGTQNKNEVVKLVLAGNKGNIVQIWSNPVSGVGIDTKYALGDLLADSSQGLVDIASLEMILVIDKAAGTVTPVVTLYDAAGAVIGGLRVEPTAGFATAQAESLPVAVLDNLLDPAAETAVGVTSNDYGTLGSFEARWENLRVTTPDGDAGGGSDPWLIGIGDAPTITESGDTGTTSLSFALTTDASVNTELVVQYSLDGGATTQTTSLIFTDGVGTLAIEVANDDVDNGPDALEVTLVGVDDSHYAIDPNSNTASGTVTEDDAVTLIGISDAPTVTESGDTGTTSLAFALTTDASVTAALVLEYILAGGATSQTQSVTFTNGAGTLTVNVLNDDVDNGPDTVEVTLVGIGDSQYAIDPNANTASGIVEEDDQETGGGLFELDFETAGDPLIEGGFDGVLGGISDTAVVTTVEGGDLVVLTSNGDIIKSQSANDFIKYVDLSDAALNELHISSHFDNAFPEALAAQGLSTATIPNYAQQGLLFGLGTQNKNEVVKLVLAGNKGNIVQIWSNPVSGVGIDTKYALGDLLADSSQGLADIASLEMTLVIDKAAGTVTPVVTLYDAAGAVIGGLRVEPTAGFATAQAESLPVAVLDNLLDPAAETAVGVTSNDYGTLGSFEARWEDLRVTTPDGDAGGGSDPWLIGIGDAPTVAESGDTGTTSLSFALTTDASVNTELVVQYSLDGGATSQTQSVTFTDGAGTLTIEVVNDAVDDGDDHVSVLLIGTGDSHYAIDASTDTASGVVIEDDASAPTSAEQVFGGAGLDDSEAYDPTAVGSAVVTILPGATDVQESNYGSNSFKVTNTGDKKIAAVFFDVRPALYGNSVFDPDGKGGDSAFKAWAIDTSGGTGAIPPSGYEHYYLMGPDPDPTEGSNNGGFRGALVKFSSTTDGGFTQGETVGFSGDMDPNSIAGMAKGGTLGVDTGSEPAWDVGGVSGAELIGARVYVQFTDGSIASAQLMGDGSQAGSQARVTEATQNLQAGLTVNGVAPGEVGSYGGELPTVVVSGEPGTWVRVVMTKGHQPVANTNGSLAEIVDWRLSDSDFAANNAAEFQFVDVLLDASGQADVSDQFTYGNFLNETQGFDGDNNLPLGYVAAVIEDPTTTGGLPLGPVTAPLYLASNGTPVDQSGGAATTSFSTLSAESTGLPVIGESGVVSLEQTNSESWKTVAFAEPLKDPAVVMGPLTSWDGEPATVSVRNVTETGFEFQIDEWDYLDGSHGQEVISWLAINSGTHTLPNGQVIAAGKGLGSGVATEIPFGTDFGRAPIVLAQTATASNAMAVTHRIEAVDGDSFSLRLQREEADATEHGSEAVDWIAVSEGGTTLEGLLAGRTGAEVSDVPFDIAFDGSFDNLAFLADMQTAHELDPATVRLSAIDQDGATVFIEEEQSADNEVEHMSEDVGFVGLNTGLINAGDSIG